ncbi:uncharacterized protein K02A2.6-like [Aedes albopictus]|uniref:Reverse transcriptase domain-containing protein n=1 Tax=Aedes albopictus TaxID=7160 RepID=A0ABM2A604_AEDAL
MSFEAVAFRALEPKVYDFAIELLDTYFQAGRQDVIERRKLRKLKQESNEKFSHYVIRLRQQALNCGFEKCGTEVTEILKEIYLVDVIVENCRSDDLRKAILKRDRSIREIEEIAATIEDTDQQMKELKEHANTSREVAVYEVNRPNQARPAVRRNSTADRRTHRGQLFGVTSKREVATKLTAFKGSKSSCFACGQSGHLANSPDCPARGRICRRCRELGHFETVCRKQKQRSEAVRRPRKIYNIDKSSAVEQEEEDKDKRDDSPEPKKVYYAFYGGNQTNLLDGVIGGIAVKVLIDSGADANLIRLETWKMMKERKVIVVTSTKGTTVAEFFVVNGGQKDILGDATAKKLGVLKVGIEVNNVDKEMKPFSKIKGVKAQIRMMADARPVFQPVRRVPIPMEDAVNRKLDQLLQRDIIEVKQGPATWVSPLVIVGKTSGEPRICLDLRQVNEAVVREHFPMPVVDEYLARLGRGKIWSKLDIREAFHQIELDDDSRDVATFITNKGLFRFKRLPFGLVTAPEIFQRIMEEILSGCEGTYWYLDDVMVEGETKEIHDKNLKKVLDRFKERGVELNWEKCEFGVSRLEFLGYDISKEERKLKKMHEQSIDNPAELVDVVQSDSAEEPGNDQDEKMDVKTNEADSENDNYADDEDVFNASDNEALDESDSDD